MSEDVVDLLLRGDIYGNCKADRCMCSIMEDGAEEIKRLRAENEKLREALKPFADEASVNRADDDYYFFGAIKIGDLRAAAAALKETDNV